MNPGVTRLAIVVALVVGGIAVLANGFSDGATQAAPPDDSEATQTESPSPTETESPTDEVVPNKENVLVQVLNGTNVAGLAGDVQILLDAEGYLRAGEPADAPDKPILDTIVYFRKDEQGAQNRADAQLLAKDYLSEAPVEPLPATYAEDIIDPAADVVVVMGEDLADAF